MPKPTVFNQNEGGMIFASLGAFGIVWRHFLKITTGMMLPASSELRPGRLLHILQYTKTSLYKEFSGPKYQ